ncbi:cyclase family protein [uncultured Paludibaculum sp.]|uniref:cyclase family protein n=1 Tax=uncultured Paludibaculum sp. TaxID=1765020 RepID=UPI002AABDC06|nr:cyclase family protein [uncultured Paludibaculum sp.]
MLIKLSHNLSEHTPFYSSLPKPKLNQIYDLAKGDTCNSYYFTTSNHAGTHVDAPRHFNPQGRAITDYQLDEFVFTRPTVLDVPLHESELIQPSHLEPALAVTPLQSDILLIRTGFGRHRQDERRYVDQGPGFGPDAASYLMATCPALRAIAMDFPSVSALAHEEAGAAAHRIFLGCTAYADRPILLIEDALIPDDLPTLQRITLMPWLFDGLDSAPCTLFAEAAPHA